MKKLIFLTGFLSLFLIGQKLFAQLSPNAEISILTCSPGEELYSTFGHTAIRVSDPQTGIDLVYNYGTFNFRVPNFYAKFVRGYLNYMLAVDNFEDFMAEYKHDNRSVYEQVLNLTQYQKEKVFDFLEWNRLPENKYYQYDFFFDNCATRVRDVMEKTLGDSLKFEKRNIDLSMRHMLNNYLDSKPWLHTGINCVLGLPADMIANTSQTMFLPDYLDTAFTKATILQNREQISLIKKRNVLFERTPTEKSGFDFFSPFIMLSLFFVLLIFVTYLEYKRKKIFKIIDVLIFTICGLISVLVIFLWFFTAHKAVVQNLNILWALPTHLFAVFMLVFKSKSVLLKKYFGLSGMFFALVFLLAYFIPQGYDIAIYPVILILALRSLNYYYNV